MMNEKEIVRSNFIPDYFIVGGEKIGKQDERYPECVNKFCRKVNLEQTKDKEGDKANESQESEGNSK